MTGFCDLPDARVAATYVLTQHDIAHSRSIGSKNHELVLKAADLISFAEDNGFYIKIFVERDKETSNYSAWHFLTRKSPEEETEKVEYAKLSTVVSALFRQNPIWFESEEDLHYFKLSFKHGDNFKVYV